MTLEQQLNTARMQVKVLEAAVKKEGVTAIELAGGKVLNLQEAVKEQQADAEKAETESAVASLMGIGMSEAAAKAAVKGRETRGW